MADISDIEQTVAATIISLLYPQGVNQSSIVGTTCRVYRGWPNSAALNADLQAGIVNVTVVSDEHSGKTTTRYIPEWHIVGTPPTLTAHVIGQTISIGGSASVGNVIGALVDGLAYVYRISSGDSPDVVAGNLSAAMEGEVIATSHGPNIYLPAATTIAVRVVRDSTGCYEGRRQEKDVRVVCWCSTPGTRDALAATIDNSMSQCRFLLLPDGSQARITYRNTTTSDQAQNALLYRRDLIYCVEYPTLVSENLPSMLFGVSTINRQVTFG